MKNPVTVPAFFALRPWLVAVVLWSVLPLTGCKPNLAPSPFVDRHPLVLAKTHTNQPVNYTTRHIKGVDYRISPYPIGRYGGVLVRSSMGDGPKTFNNWASYDATSGTLSGLMLAGLVETDPHTGQVIPSLAKSWQLHPDRCTYTVQLRRGLQWSDGHPLTAEDVLFTWNTIIAQGLGNPSNRDSVTVDGKMPTVTALDAHTIQFKTPRPFAPFLAFLSQPIAPAHILGPRLKKEGNKAFSQFWNVQEAVDHPEKLVSCGMWRLTRYEPGEKLTYAPNPYYWVLNTQNQRLPYIQQLVVRLVKDQNAQALQFEQGNIDDHAIAGRDLTHVRQLRRPTFTLYNLGPNTSTTFLAFNQAIRHTKEGKPVVDPIKTHWFRTQVFRQAVSCAVDRENIVRMVLKGIGAPLFTAESLSSVFVHPQLAKGHPRNLNKARALLKQAGFTWQADGQLLDEFGHPVRFTLMTNTGNDEREAVGVSLKQDLAELGITIDFKPIEFNILVGKLQGTGEWDAIVLSLTGNPLEPHSGANVWRSNGGLHLFNQRENVGENAGNTLPTDRLPWEVTLDQLLDTGASTLEIDSRKQVYYAMQQLLFDQQPLVYLYSGLSVVAVRDRVQNLDPTPLSGHLHNMESLWIRP
jgi:peptide/nickel transport system substrate-binding protein